jgi:hypothetical protein
MVATMWFRRRILTGEALIKKAKELGVNIYSDDQMSAAFVSAGREPLLAHESVIQQRVRDAERHSREGRLFYVATAAALAAVIGAGMNIYNGKQQTENAKRLLSVQLAREFDQRFESEPMRHSRAELAAALLRGAVPPTDDVQDFFRTVGYYVRQGALDSEVVWNDFGYTITHYWPALRAGIETDRHKPDGDPEDYANFEWLNTTLLEDAAHRRHVPVAKLIQSATDVRDFLKDEAELVPHRKAAQGGARRK